MNLVLAEQKQTMKYFQCFCLFFPSIHLFPTPFLSSESQGSIGASPSCHRAKLFHCLAAHFHTHTSLIHSFTFIHLHSPSMHVLGVWEGCDLQPSSRLPPFLLTAQTVMKWRNMELNSFTSLLCPISVTKG